MYKTTIKVVILSEEEYEGNDLETINYDIMEGHCSGQLFDVKRNVKLTDKEMAEALQEQGSDPEFFNLTADGTRVKE